MKKMFLFLFIMTAINAFSQYTQQWVDRLNGSESTFDVANNMFLDAQSNAYVYSTVFNEGNFTDINVIKYSSAGIILWKYNYNNPASGIDQLQDVYKDASDFSYFTGFAIESERIKLLTIKLSSQGDTSWTKITTIPNYETLVSHSITTDNSGNIFVLLDGRNLTHSRNDFIIVKYSPAGNILAQKIVEGSNDGNDNGIKIICDTQGNVFAGVNSFYSSSATDIALYKFDNNLNEIYFKKINGTANSDDGVVDMKLAFDNNILLTGRTTNTGTASDIGTFKLANSNGDILWQKFYNGIGNDIDLPYAMTTDLNNNILITGYARNSPQIQSEDVITLKYGSNGDLLWSRVYNDSVNGTDQGYSICTDVQSNVYIGGAGDHGNGHLGYLALKYNSGGNLIWKGSYHYFHLSEDFVYKIAVNNLQDIFLTGISFSDSTDYDVTTIKYARQTGIYSNPEYVNEFKLYANYPNPFNPVTKIRFYNPQRNFITLKVFDLNGREVALLENKNLTAGNYEYEFNPVNLSSGVYFYRVYYGENFKTGKMTLLK